MPYAQKWQELFELAERPPVPPRADAHLKHTTGPWTAASGAAATLRTSTEKSRRRLRSAHAGVAPGAVGLAAVAELAGVLESWEERLAAVRGECDHLAGALLGVARDMGGTDDAVRASFGSGDREGIAAGRPLLRCDLGMLPELVKGRRNQR
ncbi:hypothetical protein ACIBJC_28335 [Streptomyces sp. NPDC050509]|uniref:hypothetical protein n=1 Tax=Streptomyces sp. NPDC050509 TaxID=3365620 RepID=UPI0037A62727